MAQALQLTAVTSVDHLFGVQINSQNFGCWHGLARGGRTRPFALHQAQRRLTLSVTTDGKSSTGCVVTGSQWGVLELSSGRLQVGGFIAQQGAPLSA